jgi:hypothetical protein
MGADIARLENEKDCRKVQANHKDVMLFYEKRNDKMESCVETLRGKIYSEEEKAFFKETGRTPISINKALAPFRTIIGVLSNSMFDASFMPVGEEDQEFAGVLSKLATYEEKRNDDFNQNSQAAQAALATGRGYRLCQVDTPAGDKARISSVELNPFAVYFDPDSREPITRGDAKFVDVCHWLSDEEIISKYPEAEGKIKAGKLNDRMLRENFEEYDKSTDRRHEAFDDWNGKHKVVERYYKASKKKRYVLDEATGDVYEADGQVPHGMPSITKTEEYLYLAVWAPDLLDDDSFLSNEEYHVQPRDPDTKKIIWPVVELVSDNMLGESDGFIEFIKDPQKLFSVLYTQLVEAAKHSSGSYTIDPKAFVTPEEADRAKKYKALSNQVYEVKEGYHGRAIQPIASNSVSNSTLQSIANIEGFFNEGMSSTPALQGMSESATTAASLNAQRIEQSTVQLTAFFNYFKRSLLQMLKLRYAYWRETYTEEMTFRIFDPNNGMSEQIVINQIAKQPGWNGMPTGELHKLYDMQSAEFDVVIVESIRSRTYLDKQQIIIGDMLKNPALAANPVIANVLVEWQMRLSDLPWEAKEQIKQQMQAQTQALQTQNQLPPQVAGEAA